MRSWRALATTPYDWGPPQHCRALATTPYRGGRKRPAAGCNTWHLGCCRRQGGYLCNKACLSSISRPARWMGFCVNAVQYCPPALSKSSAKGWRTQWRLGRGGCNTVREQHARYAVRPTLRGEAAGGPRGVLLQCIWAGGRQFVDSAWRLYDHGLPCGQAHDPPCSQQRTCA